MASDLRSRLIRLAHDNAALRPHILPLLKESAGPVEQEVSGWKLKWVPERANKIQLDSDNWSDEAIRYPNGKVAYDNPDRIPANVRDAVERMFRKVRRS